jgi:hypothetical protein
VIKILPAQAVQVRDNRVDLVAEALALGWIGYEHSGESLLFFGIYVKLSPSGDLTLLFRTGRPKYSQRIDAEDNSDTETVAGLQPRGTLPGPTSVATTMARHPPIEITTASSPTTRRNGHKSLERQLNASGGA